MEGFHERMHRLLLMAPLYSLQRRRKIAFADGNEVTGMELGMVSLLYFFELMLGGGPEGLGTGFGSSFAGKAGALYCWQGGGAGGL